MQIDGHATNQDLLTLVDDLCDSDDTSYPVQKKVLNLNAFYEELIGEIISADGMWQWDDTNHTDMPRGKATLVEGQTDYSFASEYLDILELEILNKEGTRYSKIQPIDEAELGGISADEYFGTNSSGNPTKGIPQYYDKVGDSIRLYPAPAAASMTLTNGLRISYKRTADLFTTSDTTQEPGLPSPYHSILAYGAALPYCRKYKKDIVASYERKVDTMKNKLLKFYSRREKDSRKVGTTNSPLVK